MNEFSLKRFLAKLVTAAFGLVILYGMLDRFCQDTNTQEFAALCVLFRFAWFAFTYMPPKERAEFAQQMRLEDKITNHYK